jgi:hypothetical protein
LPDNDELARGMKVLVINNIATDLDIILHAEEPPVAMEAIVHLKKMPICIMVKLTRTRASHLDGLEESVVPVEPLTSRTEIEVSSTVIMSSKHRHTTVRRQFPITPAYAFTDSQLQGQTISHVIVDLALSPSGPLTLFNVYVALS